MPNSGLSWFFIANLLFHSSEKLRRATFLCFTKFLVSKKKHGLVGGNDYHDYPSRIFYLILLKNSIGEPFRVCIVSSSEKFFD